MWFRIVSRNVVSWRRKQRLDLRYSQRSNLLGHKVLSIGREDVSAELDASINRVSNNEIVYSRRWTAFRNEVFHNLSWEGGGTGCAVRKSNPSRDKISSLLWNLPDRLGGPTCRLVNRYRGFVAWIKQPGREVGHSPASSAEVKKKWNYTSPISPHGVDTDNFTLF